MKPRKQRRRPNGAKPSREVLEDARERGATQAEVAREQGVTPCAVHRQCRRFGVVLPLDRSRAKPRKQRRRPDGKTPWPDVLEEALTRGVSQAQVAREQGVTRAVAHQQCRRYGIVLPPGDRAPPATITRDVLKEALEAGLRACEVATALGVTPPAVVKAQARHGIYLRGARNPQAKGR